MNKISKKSAFGIATVGAAAALVVGFAAPAMASTSHDSSLTKNSTHSASSTHSNSTTKSDRTATQAQLDALRTTTTGIGMGTGSASNSSPVVVDPSLNAPVSTGSVGSGNAVASGNDVPLLSGNTVSVPVASGNDSAVGNNDGNNDGSTAGNDVGNTVGNTVATGGINTSVQNLVNSVLGSGR